MATIERQIDRSATTDLPKRKKGENPNKTTNLFHNVTFSEDAEDSYNVFPQVVAAESVRF